MKNKSVVAVAKSAGFCFGVRRAITLAEETARGEKKRIYTLGPLIHNPQEVRRLGRCGIRAVASPARLKDETLILRTHGIPAGLRERLAARHLTLVDATCPFVKRAQEIVKQFSAGDVQIILVGEKTHPEVVALVSYGKGKCVVVENLDDLKKVALGPSVAVVSQTTQTPENFATIIRYLKKRRRKLTVFNTICRATIDRQTAARTLARRVDAMVIVGGKNSGNTRRLAEICRAYTPTWHIETAAELRPRWFSGKRCAGITAGASTPDWIIHEVKDTITTILQGGRLRAAGGRRGRSAAGKPISKT